MLHCREGFIPLAVVATRPKPARRMLPWNTCGHTQGLVRRPIQPSSIECNFMSRRTLGMSRRTRRHPIAQSACIRAAPSAWFAGERRYHWQTVVSRSARRRRRADLCPASRTSWAAKHRPVAVQREAHPQRLPVHFFVFVHRQTNRIGFPGKRCSSAC